MLRLGKQSLNRKLTFIVAASVLSAVFVIALASLWQEAERHTRAKVNYLDATAAVFASATSQAVAVNDRQGALIALRGVARAPSILFARVATPDGASLAEIGSGVSLATDARYSESSTPSTFGALTSGTIEVSTPIVQGGNIVGRITLVADNSDLAPSLWRNLAQTMLGALAALIVGVAIAARLKQWVVRPLLRLTDAISHISQSHDYATRVDIASDDEVGELCAGFNVMLGEIKDRERRIIDLALHDAETDLPNRLAFERDLSERLARPRTKMLIVGALGIDRFQYVRGVIGYQLANDLLGELGARILSSGGRGVAARLTSDTLGFVIEASDVAAAEVLATQMVAAAETPMRLGVNALDVGVSMGLAIHGVHADAPDALIERAHIAIDQARAAHAKFALFDPAAYANTARNLSLMSDMMRALTNGEMSIHLQPKYDIRASAVTGVEALVRWKHAVRGMVPPDMFIGMAEETGAIGPLTEWVLSEAIAFQHRMIEKGFDLSVAVNLSGRLLGDSDFIEYAVVKTKQAPGPLVLEITETASIDSQDRALQHLDALVAAGASISIDDYGSGLSSLSYLKRIPADELKIDKAFIQALGEVQRDALMVKSTIDLAHSLGMKVTAEGVETEAALAALATMGCDRAQGYLIAKPMAEADLVRFLEARQTDAGLALKQA